MTHPRKSTSSSLAEYWANLPLHGPFGFPGLLRDWVHGQLARGLLSQVALRTEEDDGTCWFFSDGSTLFAEYIVTDDGDPDFTVHVS